MSVRMSVWGVVLTLLAVSSLSAAPHGGHGGRGGGRGGNGQGGGQNGGGPGFGGWPPVTIEGAVQKIGLNQIEVIATDKDKQAWLITTGRITKIEVTGTAKADFLRPGLSVKFKAESDGRTVKDKVGELTIVTPAADQYGITTEDGKPLVTAKTGAHDSKAMEGAWGAERAGVMQTCTIVGRISACRGGKLTLQGVANRPFSIELTDEPKIDVSVSDTSIVAVGDKAEVRGSQLGPQPGKCFAGEVKFTLAEPLAGPKKRVPPKASETALDKTP